MNAPTHITRLPEGATIIAWHTSLDYAAIRLRSGREALLVHGCVLNHGFPVQAVVALCGLPKADAARIIRSMY